MTEIGKLSQNNEEHQKPGSIGRLIQTRIDQRARSQDAYEHYLTYFFRKFGPYKTNYVYL
jgi:hypothetical protein